MLKKIGFLLCIIVIVINLLKKFPSLVFLIDCGFDYPISVKKYTKKLNDQNVKNFKIILGTESLKNFNLHLSLYKVFQMQLLLQLMRSYYSRQTEEKLLLHHHPQN